MVFERVRLTGARGRSRIELRLLVHTPGYLTHFGDGDVNVETGRTTGRPLAMSNTTSAILDGQHSGIPQRRRRIEPPLIAAEERHERAAPSVWLSMARGESVPANALYEDEALILARPAHAVVAGCPADDDDSPAALIGSLTRSQPCFRTRLSSSNRGGRAASLQRQHFNSSLNLRCGRNRRARRVQQQLLPHRASRPVP